MRDGSLKIGKTFCFFALIFCLSLNLFSLVAFASEVESKSFLFQAQNSFRNIADKVYPTVVSITAITSGENNKSGVYYVPKSDPLFDNFFGEYFGTKKKGVNFKMPDRQLKKVSVGSGVIIDPRGYILTNQHTLENTYDDRVRVRLADGRVFDGLIKGSDPRYDIAIIKITDENDFPFAKLGDSNTTAIGDWAIAIGNPYGFAFDDASPTMTVGVVSALNRSLPGWIGMKRCYTNLIQTDAAINVGNSGGPLIDIDGFVIGINVAIVSTTGASQGLGFAIPTALCRDIITEIIDGKEVLYSWLGLTAQNLTHDLANYFNYPYVDGVLVIKSLENSPAKIGGVRDKDIITKFNEKKIIRLDDLVDSINKCRVGEKVTITVYRDEQEHEIDIIMGSRPRRADDEAALSALYWRGLQVDNVTYQMAQDLSIPTLKGVVVTDVKANSSADRAGITQGEVITTISGSKINNVDDYYAAIYELNGDALVKSLRGFFVLKK